MASLANLKKVLYSSSVLVGVLASFPCLSQTYIKDIRPILKERCVVCHNVGALSNTTVSGGLALDSFMALKRGTGLKLKPVFLANKSEQSELYTRLITSGSKLMPRGGPPLPKNEMQTIKKWIDSGAISGDLTSETEVVVKTTVMRMPPPSNSVEVLFPIRCEATADLKSKSTPMNASFSLSLKVGPLPSIASLAFSPNGKILAVGGYRAVFLWDVAVGIPFFCVNHLPGQVLSLSFKPDGSLLAISGGVPGTSGDVSFLDMKTMNLSGAPIKAHQDVISSVAWSPDGMKLVTGSQDRTARIWDASTGKELKVLKDHSDAVSRVCFTSDGKSVYTASFDHNVRRFDVATGETQKTFSGHNEAINALVLSSDGKRVISSGNESNLRWWNTESGDVTNNNGGHAGVVNDLTLSKDGKLILSASADHTLRLWDSGNTGQIRAFEGSPDWVYTGVFSADTRVVAGSGPDGIVRIWETATGKLRLNLLAWSPSEKSPVLNWIASTPEGYFASSPEWKKRLSLNFGSKPLVNERVVSFLTLLYSPEITLKAWNGAPIEIAKFPAPPTLTAKKTQSALLPIKTPP